jgi:N-acetyl-gamma-glutamyl-phosphate reductase
MIKVGIIGATGYTGNELVRILAQHPEAEITAITSRTHAGKKLEEVYGNFTGWDGPTFSGSDSTDAVAGCDVVFLALPHGVALEMVPSLLEKGQKVIDLGADFRFRDAATYRTWYKLNHTQEELTKTAVYGLPEIHRKEIRRAMLIGNPGCYPTSVILPVYPLLKEGLIEPDRIIIDSKSGVSGAGRKAEFAYNYPELFGNFKAYGLAGHRHTPEIEQELSHGAGKEVKVSFTPHLLPVARGILSTIHLTLAKDVTTQEVEEVLARYYQGEPFVKIIKEPQLPELKWVIGTNCCQIGVRVDRRVKQLILVSVIDNMVKGASGQAVQNMNLLCDLPETMGLQQQWPVYP